MTALLFYLCFIIVKQSSGQSTDYSDPETLPCGSSSNYVLNIDHSVAIETPNYPDQYGPFERCIWKIKVPPNSNLSIECQDFDLHRSDKFCIKDRKMKANSKCYKGTASWWEDPYTFAVHDFNAKFVIIFKSNRKGEGYGFRCILSNNVGGGNTSEEPPSPASTSPSPLPPSPTSPTASTSSTTSGQATSAQPSTCECGKGGRKDQKIVGGQTASSNEYPWQVGLLSSSGSLPFCGGSLISPTEVLTAAHCTSGQSPASIAVSLGEHDISDFQAVTASVCQIIDHPKYNFPDYDFSILQLCSPVAMDSSVSPVCLPADISQTYSGQVATVTGWGTLSSGGARPDTLMEVNVTVITNQVCDANYDTISVTDAMICAADPGKDSCQGDSGGPLVTSENERYKLSTGHINPFLSRFALIGVVSFGIGCANPDFPGVYARVTAVKDWINENSSGVQDTNCQ